MGYPATQHTLWDTNGGFIKGILRGVRCTKSLRVLFLHRRPPSWTTLVLYSRAVFIFNEPALSDTNAPQNMECRYIKNTPRYGAPFRTLGIKILFM